MRHPFYPWYQSLAGVSITLALIASPWHFRAKNIGTMMWLWWGMSALVLYIINITIWSDMKFRNIPIWCEFCECFEFGEDVRL